MTTVQKNFTITEGARNRLIVRLPEDVSASDYTVYAGNDKCKCRHLKYEVASVGEHHITLLSEPASPDGTIPYQIFIKDNNTDVEWLLASGNIIVIKRMVGIPGISGEWIDAPIDGHDTEVEAPLDEQIIDIDVEITYTKEDLDEAVRKAIEAKEAACTYKTQACQAAGAAELYAGNASSAAAVACGASSTAHTWANSASSWANCASNYADSAYSWASKACEYKDQTLSYKNQACCYKKKACEYSASAQTSASQADTAMTHACSARTAACSAAGSAYTWATNASTSAGEACNAANNAAASKGEACCYKKKACTYSTQASSSATLASVYSSSAGSYKSQTCCYKKKACEYLDEMTGIAATKQDKLTAGTNISITKVGDDTYICATGGGGEGDVKLDADNEFTGFNYFKNDGGIALLSGGDCNHLYNNNGPLYWGSDQVLTSADRTATPSSGSNNVITAGGVYTHTSNNNIHVTSTDKTAWNNHINDSGKHVTPDEKTLVLDYVRTNMDLMIRTVPGTNRGGYSWLTLDQKFVTAGLLTNARVMKRDTSGTVVNCVYLMIFQMQEGGNPLSPKTWQYMGTSKNAVTADYGTGYNSWDFDNLELAGNMPVAFKFTTNKDQTVWAPDTSIGVRVAPKVDGDCSYMGGGTAWTAAGTSMTTLVNTLAYYKSLEARVKALEDK